MISWSFRLILLRAQMGIPHGIRPNVCLRARTLDDPAAFVHCRSWYSQASWAAFRVLYSFRPTKSHMLPHGSTIRTVA
jgi:hypothetical protein